MKFVYSFQKDGRQLFVFKIAKSYAVKTKDGSLLGVYRRPPTVESVKEKNSFFS